MANIEKIILRKIYDSTSNPTIEAEVLLDNGICTNASAPKTFNIKEQQRYYDTNSFGKVVSLEPMRDYYNKAIGAAIEKVNELLIPEIKSMNINNQEGIDYEMLVLNGKKDLFNSIINTTFAISCAVAKAGALNNDKSLYEHIRSLFGKRRTYQMPIPLINIFDGGIFTNNNLNFQSIMVAPVKAASFKDALRMGAEVFHSAKKILHDKGMSASVGDQGGYAPVFCSHEDTNVGNWDSITIEALEIVVKSITLAGYKAGQDILIGINVNADSGFYSERTRYCFTDSEQKEIEISRKELQRFYENIAKKYPIVFMENCFAEDDPSGWQGLTGNFGEKIQVAGYDVAFGEGKDKEKMIRDGVMNNVVISTDRVPTLSELLKVVNFSENHRLRSLIRSGIGDTEDPVVADITIGCNIDLIHSGGFSRTERLAKHNQLLRIEEALGNNAVFHPKNTFSF